MGVYPNLDKGGPRTASWRPNEKKLLRLMMVYPDQLKGRLKRKNILFPEKLRIGRWRVKMILNCLLPLKKSATVSFRVAALLRRLSSGMTLPFLLEIRWLRCRSMDLYWRQCTSHKPIVSRNSTNVSHSTCRLWKCHHLGQCTCQWSPCWHESCRRSMPQFSAGVSRAGHMGHVAWVAGSSWWSGH